MNDSGSQAAGRGARKIGRVSIQYAHDALPMAQQIAHAPSIEHRGVNFGGVNFDQIIGQDYGPLPIGRFQFSRARNPLQVAHV